MHRILIRAATRNDLPEILHKVKELALFEKEPDGVTTTLKDYQRLFDEGLFAGLVAEEENEVIGIAIYYYIFSTWKGKALYLEDFYVDKDRRSAGIGQLLFDELISIAKKEACTKMKWQVLDWNSSAIKFYERNGAHIEKEWWNGVLEL